MVVERAEFSSRTFDSSLLGPFRSKDLDRVLCTRKSRIINFFALRTWLPTGPIGPICPPMVKKEWGTFFTSFLYPNGEKPKYFHSSS
jgi:hypothetical protein